MPSSVIRTMHYDRATHKLRIIFVSGMVYDYLEVPEEVYREMKEAGSKGTFLNQRIKNNFSYRKIG
ncbi:MAG TPA: KTSC domain-containing protein [Puia sp.]|jgi:hypothetical protein|nr:KTSC domain-containing protein [Puia sp.]